MIRYVEPDGMSPLLLFLEQDAFGVKLAGHLRAYGVQPFAEYWMQADETGRLLAVVGRLDSALTLCTDPALFSSPALCDELAAFCRMLPGIRTLTYAKGLPLPCGTDREGVWMKIRKPEDFASLKEDVPGALAFPSVSALYTLLFECRDGEIKLPSREAFVVDMSHRFRHGAARCWGIGTGSGYAAVVFTMAETPRYGLIGGVATHPEDRGQGQAAGLLRAACHTLCREGRTPLLFCAPLAQPFYERMGFSVAGRWVETRFDVI